MWHHYWLQPTVPAEPAPVLLLIHIAFDERHRFETRLYIAGARTIDPIPGASPEGMRCVMRAGASWNRLEGVRLSNGFNVVDPDDWRGQRVGTVALNLMVGWAKRRHADAHVRPIALTRHHKTDIVPADPRLRFYRRFGLDWLDDQDRDATDWLSRTMTVAELRTVPLLPAFAAHHTAVDFPG